MAIIILVEQEVFVFKGLLHLFGGMPGVLMESFIEELRYVQGDQL